MLSIFFPRASSSTSLSILRASDDPMNRAFKWVHTLCRALNDN